MTTLSDTDFFVVQQAGGPANATLSDLEAYLANSADSYEPVVVSAAGTDQSTATVLSSLMSFVVDVTSGSGVMIASIPNKLQMIHNTGNTLRVYPPVGTSFAGFSGNQPFLLAAGSTLGVVMSSTTPHIVAFGTQAQF